MMHTKSRSKLPLSSSWTMTVSLFVSVFLLQSMTAHHSIAYTSSEMNAMRTSDEVKIKSLRDQEIEQLRIALGRRLPANRRADLYVRLAEAYVEAYRSEFIVEGKVHENKLSQGVYDKTIERTQSKPYLKKAIDTCLETIALKIPNPKLDQIYYFLGMSYQEYDDSKNAVKYFNELIRLFPQSAYVGEAYRVIADEQYQDQQFTPALSNYQNAVTRYDAAERPRVRHKLAWTYYRLRQYDRAVSTMKQVINEAQTGDQFLSLKEEALRDMALFMTEGGKVDEAMAYFKQVAGDKEYYPKALERLGKQYERHAEPKKAIQVYESLLKTHPKDEAAFRVAVKLYDLSLSRNQWLEAIQYLKNVEVPASPDEEETKTALQNVMGSVRKTAIDQHDLFRKTASRSALDLAEQYYDTYLNKFLSVHDDLKETPEIKMYLAEVKRELGKSEVASQLYREVIDSKDPRYSKTAGSLWTSALADAVKKASAAKKAEGSTPTAPSALELEFVKAADVLKSSYEKSPEAMEAQLQAAQVLAGYPSTQEDAMKRARYLMALDPQSVQAVTAARLYIQTQADRYQPQGQSSTQAGSQAKPQEDSDQIKDREKALRNSIQEVRAVPGLLATDAKVSEGKLLALMNQQEDRFKIGSIAVSEKSKDYVAAAKGYEDYAQGQTQQNIVETAYQNAMANYAKANDYASSVRVCSQWIKRYPESSKALESLRATATSALIQGRFEYAAALFEMIGKSKENKDADALELAGRLYEGAGYAEKAQNVFSNYLNLYKTKDASRIALNLAQSYEASRNDPLAVQYYKQCFKSSDVIAYECGARLGDLYSKLENREESLKIYKQVASGARAPASKKVKPKKVTSKSSSSTASSSATSSIASPWIGYARYKVAESEEQSYKVTALSLPEEQLRKTLDERLALLQKINQSYQTVVEAGGPWSVAALNRLAQWVNDFADDVDAIAPNPTQSKEAQEKFKQNLKAISSPLRQKAIQTLKNAYDKAMEGELLSPHVPLIADQLADAGTDVKRAQGFRDRFRLSGMPASGGQFGLAGAMVQVRDRLTKDVKDVKAWIDYGNLLWGEGKPLLARVAYERALGLDSKVAAALNNRGVLVVSGSGQEDWIRVAEAMQLFNEALKKDELFLAAKFNRGALLNYYRGFQKAKSYWSQVMAIAPSSDVMDGLAISMQGIGDNETAQQLFLRSDQAGGDRRRFAKVYHQAVLQSQRSPEQCLDSLKALNEVPLFGFEKQSIDYLRKACNQRKVK